MRTWSKDNTGSPDAPLDWGSGYDIVRQVWIRNISNMPSGVKLVGGLRQREPPWASQPARPVWLLTVCISRCGKSCSPESHSLSWLWLSQELRGPVWEQKARAKVAALALATPPAPPTPSQSGPMTDELFKPDSSLIERDESHSKEVDWSIWRGSGSCWIAQVPECPLSVGPFLFFARGPNRQHSHSGLIP